MDAIREILLDRFMRKVVILDDGCWEWVAYRSPDGYGQVRDGARVVGAHVWIYQFHHGPVPSGLQIDHLCRNRWCVNPKHLEAVTLRENLARGVGFSNIRSLTTHCSRGHAYTEENTYKRRDGGRQCRICKSEEGKRRRSRQRQK